MEIHIAKSAGFCFGVKRAIDIAKKAAGGVYPVRSKAPRATAPPSSVAGTSNGVYMLGELVHNKSVVKSLSLLGIRKVRSLKEARRNILFSAHGLPEKTYKEARRLNLSIIDATCPMVKKIHRIVKSLEEKKIPVIIIGDKNHQEVKGIAGQLKYKPLCIIGSPKEELPKIKGIDEVGVVVQSTHNNEEVKIVLGRLKKQIKKIHFFDTICRPTKEKQKEAKRLACANQIMLVIGSRHSANTKRLFSIAKALNQRTYWLEDKSGLVPSWFRGIDSVGITAGSSTPDEIIQGIVATLKKE